MTRDQAEQPEKRTRMRGEDRREFILCHSKEVFARYGYAEASTSELARASEVTEPMLYKHFGSKKGLYLAIMQQGSKRFTSLWRSRINQRAEKDLLDALEQVVMDYRVTLKEDPDLQKIFYQSASLTADPEIALCVQKHNRSVYLLVRQLVERVQAEGYFTSVVDLNAVTWGYVSMVLSMQYAVVLDLASELNDDVIMKMSQIWLRGLCAPQR